MNTKTIVLDESGLQVEVSMEIRKVKESGYLHRQLHTNLEKQDLVQSRISGQVIEYLDEGILPHYLRRFGLEQGGEILLRDWKDSIRYELESYESERFRTKHSIEKLKDIVDDYFRIIHLYGSNAIVKESKKRFEDLEIIKRNSIKLNDSEYLLPTNTEINYINTKTDKIMSIEIRNVRKNEIRGSRDEDGLHSAWYEKEGIKIELIINGNLVDSPSLGLAWQEKSGHLDDTGYRNISLSIRKNRMIVKIHQLYILLKTNLLVTSLCIWSGASIVNPDHRTGNRMDCAEDNIFLITQSVNAQKQGKTEEEHIRFSEKYCYDLTEDLVLLSELAMNEVEKYKYRLN